MPLIEVATSVVELGNSLHEVAGAFQKESRESRERTAALLDSIAVCLEKLSTLSTSADAQVFVAPCQELQVYLQNFLALEGIPSLIGAGRVELLHHLTNAAASRSVFVEDHPDPAVRQAARHHLNSAIGVFRATSNLIRGLPGPIPRKIRSLGLGLAAIAASLTFCQLRQPPCGSIAGSWIRDRDNTILRLSQSECEITGEVASDTGADSHHIRGKLKGRHGIGEIRRVYQGCETTLHATYEIISDDLLKISATGEGCDLKDYSESFVYRRLDP